MTKKRIAYIDILKCFGIVILLFEHTGNWIELGGIYNPIKIWICSFHMPLFFIAYGMVVRNYAINDKGIKDLLVVVENRFVGLIIPYFLWCCIYAAGYGSDFFRGVLYGTNQSLGVAATNQVLWFLPAFFVAALVYQMLLALANRIDGNIVYWIIAMTLCACISLFLKSYAPAWGWWFGLDIALTGCVFMIVGKYLRILVDWFEKKNILLRLLAVVLLFFIGMKCAQYNVPSNSWVTIMAVGFYGKNYILFILNAIMNTFAMTLFAGIIANKTKMLAWLGENSLVIMAVHYIVFPYSLNICRTYLSNIYWNSHCASNILIPVGNVIITCLICIPIIWMVCRYMPILKGK